MTQMKSSSFPCVMPVARPSPPQWWRAFFTRTTTCMLETMKTLRLSLLATLVLLMSTHSVLAEPRGRFENDNGSRQQERPVQRGRQASPITANEAAARVQSRTGGRVLSVKRAGNSYRVKILNQRAQVRIYTVDADSGAIR
jgi:uncharacterized membrane protein YkoI